MVCLGNICRSPLAEGVLQAKARQAGLDWEVDSAGTLAGHVGEPPHPMSQKVAKLNGVDISNQRARQFTKADLERYDKIYVMASDVMEDMKAIYGSEFTGRKVQLFLDDLFPNQNMDVPDPWYGPEPGYHDAYKLIDKACDAIIENHLARIDKKTEKI